MIATILRQRGECCSSEATYVKLTQSDAVDVNPTVKELSEAQNTFSGIVHRVIVINQVY